MANQIDERVKPFEVKMGKSIASLDSEFGTIRAGRANPHVLDRITVDYYEHRLRCSRWQTSLFRKHV